MASFKYGTHVGAMWDQLATLVSKVPYLTKEGYALFLGDNQVLYVLAKAVHRDR
jgi:hypothetical protein